MFSVKLRIRDDLDNPGYVLIESTGTLENVARCLAYIKENLPQTLSMDVHSDDIGWIIGKGGDNIRSMQVAEFESNVHCLDRA